MSYPKDTYYGIAVARCVDAHSPVLSKLCAYFTSWEDIWNASVSELVRAGLCQAAAARCIQLRTSTSAQRECDLLEQHAIQVVTLTDPAYPSLLREIAYPPRFLFYRGTLPETSRVCIAIVGSRRPSAYGRQMTSSLVADIACAPVSVVSGCAYGIDSLAHTVCLDAGGVTHAVLGGGIDEPTIYPSTNRNLIRRMIEQGGCVFSEYPPLTTPFPAHFPARNRILSGMSKAVLVIEAALQSGALITARCALEQNRDVCVVPGSVLNPLSEGPLSLIKQGAYCVTCASDIFDLLDISYKKESLRAQGSDITGVQARVWNVLSREPMHIDDIAVVCNLDIPAANSTLVMMELEGRVRNLGNMMYVRA